MAININPVAVDPTVAARPEAQGRSRSAPEKSDTEVRQERPATTASELLGQTAERIVSENNVVEVSFDDSIRRVVIKVKSEADGEVVKQIPPEEYQRFLAKLKEMIGVIFDETA